MKKKNVFFSVLASASLFATAFTISSCGNDKPKEEQYKIYELAKESGFTGTYEEWLATVKGADGKDGREIELSIQDNKIVWHYKGETTWKDIYSINDLIGPKGDEGDKGEDGKDGVTITKIEKTSTDELMDTYTITYSDETTSTFIVTNGMDGVDGEQGIQGVPGTDGTTPTISINTEGYWVINDVVTEIKAQGIKGDTGDKGEPGTNGKSAYELYLETHPEYEGTVQEWLDDLVNGRLGTEEKIYHTVKFITDSDTVIEDQEVEHFYKVTKPNDPVKEGYTFEGWYVDGEEWNFNVFTVTEDITLEAKWKIEPYKAKFILRDGTVYYNSTFYPGDKIELPEEPSTSFKGWQLNGVAIDKNTVFNQEKDIIIDEIGPKFYTYNTYTSKKINNWNPLIDKDEKEFEISKYVNSNLFDFDYNYDLDSKPIKGDYRIDYGAAVILEDVTDIYSGNPKWNIPTNSQGYAYKVTLRNNLKWDDGTKITGEDFVYSMKELLNPYFKTSSGYKFVFGDLEIVGAKSYYAQAVDSSTTNLSVPWSNVGIFSKNEDSSLKENEFVFVLERNRYLLDRDGYITLDGALKLNTFRLVKKDLYEANKVSPSQGNSTWTSKYNTSIDTSASWGPYKITRCQSNEEYVLERNPYWYGYQDAMVEGQYDSTKNFDLYKADRITCKFIEDELERIKLFEAGKLDVINLSDEKFKNYSNSSQAIATATDKVFSLQIQSDKNALISRQTPGINKSILANINFRKAISLALDRRTYNNNTSPASKPGYGLFTELYYNNVENGEIYRESSQAKKALCEVYGVDISKFNSLDEAYASITGYDLTTARTLVDQAVSESLLETNGYKIGDKVVLTFGSNLQTETDMKNYKFISNVLTELVKGTKLEGKIEVEYQTYGYDGVNLFRQGKYDLCIANWAGSAWDPGYFLMVYLSPSYMFSSGWDTRNQMLRLQVPGIGSNFETVELEMSLYDWYKCLNYTGDARYDFRQGVIEDYPRLIIISALEKEILNSYYTIPVSYKYEGKLISYKNDYITREYNTFMKFSELKYLVFNYSEVEWAKYCNDNKLDYKA